MVSDGNSYSDLFSCKFREEISFTNFLERSILKLPLSKLCIVPFAQQNRALFGGGEQAKKVPRKGEEEGWQAKETKRKKGRIFENRSVPRRTWSGQKLLSLQFPGLSLPYQGKPGLLLSCTRLRVPPVALHVSRYTCRS